MNPPSVKDYIKKRLEGKEPYTSVGRDATAEDPAASYTPDEYASGKDLMDDFEGRQAEQEDLRQATIQANALSNFGNAFSQVAQGTTKPQSNDDLYKNMQAQGAEFMKGSAADLDRRARVQEAIQRRAERKYETDQRALDRQESRDARFYDRQVRREDKQKAQDEKDQKYKDERDTPFGLARTTDDAKKIKEGAELKTNFDRKLDEMIDLREKYGAEAWNREAVGRGQQLSKDLLLLYKDMAKLGVLSQSDENILNKIIPSDPLEWNASSFAGQDPTMTRLRKFKEDASADFQNRLQTRLRNPGDAVKTSQSAPGGKIRVSNGSETLEIDASDLKDAESDGYKRVS